MPMRRRQALAVLSGAAAAGLVGCGGEPPLRIAVVWSGWELTRFREVLDERDVVVYSAGDNIAALLGDPVAPAATPDVAIMPRAALVEDPRVCVRLQSLPSPDPPHWQRLLWCGADASVKGVWFKVAHKSLVWYRSRAVPEPSTDWESWVAACRRRAKERPPLAIGAADGWVLTDWFENVLLGLDREAYRMLHRDPDGWADDSVREALLALAELWHIENLVPGGGRRALVTQFHDSILDVFRYGRADMVAAPDFAWPVIDRYGAPGEEARRVRFPWPGGGSPPPVVAGGDAVLALASSGERGAAFVTALTDRVDRLEGWAAAGGFLSLDRRVRRYPPPLRGLAEEVRGDFEFDLSDRLTGGLAGGDGQGLWRVLTRLFGAVAVDRQRPADAVRDAVRTLVALAGGGRRT
jgi:alpha-glucoside transport system substrate-binding protein